MWMEIAFILLGIRYLFKPDLWLILCGVGCIIFGLIRLKIYASNNAWKLRCGEQTKWRKFWYKVFNY